MKRFLSSLALLLIGALTIPASAIITSPSSLNLKDQSTLQMPSAAKCNRSNARTQFGYGLSCVILGLASPMIEINQENGDEVELYFNNELVAVSDPKKEMTMNIISVMPLADDELLEFAAQTSLYIVFYPLEGFSADDLHQTGRYQVHIPNGTFMLGGEPMVGMDLTYRYTDEVPEVDFSYELSPNPAERLEDPSGLKRIDLKFTKAKNIDYRNKGGGKLINPNGEEVFARTPGLNWINTLNYEFGKLNTEWPEGVYIFSVEEGCVAVDTPVFDDFRDIGNFPGLSVIYNTGTLDITFIEGVEAASYYTVFDLSGRILLQHAPAEALQGLTSGLYIVNGRTVRLTSR